jgi:ribosomal-protein-alanine N-acetyltransferase
VNGVVPGIVAVLRFDCDAELRRYIFMESVSPFPNSYTERLILDELRYEDADSLHLHFSDKEVIKYYDLEVLTSTYQASELIKLFRRRYEKSLGIRWAIRLKGDSRFIGTFSFNSWDQKMKKSVIGHDISREY